MDFIKELGNLAISSRMKRLTDRIMRGASKVYKSLNFDFEPRWFTVFYLLNSTSVPMSISEIANSLKISHPAVIQRTQMLIKRGLIKTFQDDEDRRKRLVVVTEKGRDLASKLQPIWNDFEIATARLFESIGVDILHVVNKIERALDEREIAERIIGRIKERQYNAVEILEYDPQYKDYFKKLNLQWLKKYFEVEERDKKILSNPETEIIQKGGFIFFARLDGDIVGTTALLKVDDETYEISKMAVTEPAQGKQAGKKLADAAIGRAKSKGAKRLLLKTDNRLKAAVNLYRKLGFRVTQLEISTSGPYKREKYGIVMNLDLEP